MSRGEARERLQASRETQLVGWLVGSVGVLRPHEDNFSATAGLRDGGEEFLVGIGDELHSQPRG